MKLQIQYTEQDLLESNKRAFAHSGRKQRFGLVLGLVGWIVFLVLMGVLWFVLGTYRVNAALGTAQPVQDLVVLVLPNTLMAIFFLGLRVWTLVTQLRLSRSRAAFGDESYAMIKKGGRNGVAVFFALILGSVYVVGNLPPVEWQAGRYEAIFISFVPWIIAFITLPFILRAFNKAMVADAWSKKPSLHRPKVIEVSDEQIIITDANSTSVYRWSAFLRFRETENLFILVTEDAGFLMVPKRYLADPSVMMEFRGLLQTHISEGYFLTVPQGAFPVVNTVSLPAPPLAGR